MGRLGCLRGVGILTAFGLAVEVGDWHRFTGATVGAYLGLVPTEHSGGAQRGHHRLHQRWRRLDARGKRSTISVVAVARELAGWCWSLAVMDP